MCAEVQMDTVHRVRVRASKIFEPQRNEEETNHWQYSHITRLLAQTILYSNFDLLVSCLNWLVYKVSNLSIKCSPFFWALTLSVVGDFNFYVSSVEIFVTECRSGRFWIGFSVTEHLLCRPCNDNHTVGGSYVLKLQQIHDHIMFDAHLIHFNFRFSP